MINFTGLTFSLRVICLRFNRTDKYPARPLSLAINAISGAQVDDYSPARAFLVKK